MFPMKMIYDVVELEHRLEVEDEKRNAYRAEPAEVVAGKPQPCPEKYPSLVERLFKRHSDSQPVYPCSERVHP